VALCKRLISLMSKNTEGTRFKQNQALEHGFSSARLFFARQPRETAGRRSSGRNGAPSIFCLDIVPCASIKRLTMLRDWKASKVKSWVETRLVRFTDRHAGRAPSSALGAATLTLRPFG
jgi:hypothetical protein